MPYLSSTQLPGALVFLLLPWKSRFAAIKEEEKRPDGNRDARKEAYVLLSNYFVKIRKLREKGIAAPSRKG